MTEPKIDELARAARNGDRHAQERQKFHEETWPYLLVRLRLAGADARTIQAYREMKNRTRWSRRHQLLSRIEWEERRQLTNEAERK